MRLDALTDGVFAVAMTLLVIDLKLPENFHPATAAEFLSGLADLQTQFLVYIISFIVLGLRWMLLAKLSRLHETVEGSLCRMVAAASAPDHAHFVFPRWWPAVTERSHPRSGCIAAIRSLPRWWRCG